jgi:hypothetical protein
VVPVPAGSIELAMAIVRNWCCGSACRVAELEESGLPFEDIHDWPVEEGGIYSDHVDGPLGLPMSEDTRAALDMRARQKEEEQRLADGVVDQEDMQLLSEE